MAAAMIAELIQLARAAGLTGHEPWRPRQIIGSLISTNTVGSSGSVPRQW